MRVAFILLVAATLLASGSGAAVGSDEFTSSDTSTVAVESGYTDDLSSLHTVTTADTNNSSVLWSRDDDSDATSNTNGSASAIATIADGTDLTWTHPPKRASSWTRQSFADFARNFSTNGDRSVHPRDATLRTSEKGLIRDAHATLFALTPSTVVTPSANTSRQYLAPEGTARALIDYRVTAGSENDSVRWAIQDHRVESVCLVQDRPVGGTDTPCTGVGVVGHGSEQTPTLEYSLARPGSHSQVTLAAKIVVTAERTVVDQACANARCKSTRTQTVQDSVTVTDSRMVRVAGQRATVRTAQFPDGDRGLVVQRDRPWSSLRASGSDSLATTRWRFFTTRAPAWNTLITETESGQSVRDSTAWPARVHAVPADRERARSLGYRQQSVSVQVTRDSEMLSSPRSQLAETVHVGVVDNAYRPTRSVAIRYEKLETPPTVTGLVRGQELSTVAIGEPTQVHQSNLSIAVATHNRTHATVAVRLLDAQTGEPIDLRDRPGTVTVQGRSVNTNTSGMVLVTVPFNGAVSASYEPATWWHVGPQAYLGDTDQVVVSSTLFTVNSLAQLVTRLSGVGVSIAVVLYFIDQLPGTRAWPPWKLLR